MLSHHSSFVSALRRVGCAAVLSCGLLLAGAPTSQAQLPVLVKDIFPGADGSFPFDLTAVNGVLFFSPDDGVNGGELWKSDGTAAGTVLVKDIFPGAEFVPR